MDPLGATVNIVDLSELSPWSQTEVPTYDSSAENAASRSTSFPFDDELNAKIIVW